MSTNDPFNPIETILDHTGALVFVVDIHTNEILYANQKCVNEFGAITGKECYKVLQKDMIGSSSCCPNTKGKDNFNLQVDESFEWENKTPHGTKIYLFNTKLVDWRDKHHAQVLIGIDITEQRSLEKKVSDLESLDALTNIPNRAAIKDHLPHILKQANINNMYYALLFIDLDEFRKVNDTKGHDVGDQVLIEAKERIKRSIRKNDFIGRLGGDEFVVLVELNTKEKEKATAIAQVISHKILTQLYAPFNIDSYTFFIGASIGIVLFNDNTHSSNELMKFADSAMYRAKESGKNKYLFFDSKLHKIQEKKVELTDALRDGIQKNEFVLYYQPQVSKSAGVRTIGMEVLVRWVHPKDGVIAPDSFIPIAEESGLIIHLGTWILQEALTQLKLWEVDPLKKTWRISVNVSIKQFEKHNFVSIIANMIQEYGINPQLLRIELTENLLIKDTENALLKLHELKKLGLSISIDDFGTGYSSLAYLKILPVDELKIDQSFVRDLCIDENDRVITQTIVSIGQQFGLDVIAEGVETQEQYESLLAMGCNLFQGYLFHKPGHIDLF